jgi:type IV secretory pathway VirB10-like protein
MHTRQNVATKMAVLRVGTGWLLVSLFALFLAAHTAQAQWVWKDKDGRINASDRPPPREVPESAIMQRPAADARRAQAAAAAQPAATAASAPGAPAAQTPLEREVEARKKAAEAERAAKAAAEEEKLKARRAENCRAARGNLATLESGVRIARTNDKGEREVLEDAQRAEEMRRARDVIASDCR